ncbi:MAG: GNAT family N-acetyltransferase [Planctomycetaceae bacterium]
MNIPNLYLPNAETWVAEMDDCVVGFVALMGNEVGALFVHPDHHRSGIGHALIEKARKLRGELEVEVFTDNHIGRGFYAKQGFELINVKTHDQTSRSCGSASLLRHGKGPLSYVRPSTQ